MPRWLAAMLLISGILVTLVAGGMTQAGGDLNDVASDGMYDAIHAMGVIVGIGGISMFTIGAWRYSKRDAK